MTEIIYGITKGGTRHIVATWDAEASKYDANGWLSHNGDQVGQGPVCMPEGSWVDMSQFAILMAGSTQ